MFFDVSFVTVHTSPCVLLKLIDISNLCGKDSVLHRVPKENIQGLISGEHRGQVFNPSLRGEFE